jgi:TRAP-type C4-dicarboxylate transport system permease small subunit
VSASVRKLEDTIGIVLFTAMLVVVVTQVFVRFLLYRWVQIAWADEIGRALLVWSSFWGAVLVTRESRHITVDLVYDRLSSPMRRVLRVLGDIVMGGFMLLVMWKGLPIFLDSLVRPSPATNLPFVIFDGALWVSSALMILHVASNAWERWRLDALPEVVAVADPL